MQENLDVKWFGQEALCPQVIDLRSRIRREDNEGYGGLPTSTLEFCLAHIPAEASASSGQEPAAAREVARRLANLASRVLGCRRLSITAIEPESDLLRSVAMSGLSAEAAASLKSTGGR